MRDTARAPQPPTNPSTGHQMSRQGQAQNEQKCEFWAKNPNFPGEIKSLVPHIMETPPMHVVRIGFWADMGRNGEKMPTFGPKRPKMQILDQIWPILGQKS